MNTQRKRFLIVGGIVLLLLIFFVTSYNGLVKREEKVKLQWNEVQNSYQRRMDLLPSLVSVVKGAANFEQTTLQKLTEARAKAASVNVKADSVSATGYAEQSQAQDDLAAAANQLVLNIEKYPELQGTQAFRGLQAQLEGTERRIRFARRDFNAAVADYNSSARGFPGAVTAKLFGFKVKEGFTADAGSDHSTEIKF